MLNANHVKDTYGLTSFILSALRKSLNVYEGVVKRVHSDT